MKTETITQQQDAALKFQQARVCDLLQWMPDTMAQFIYEKGFAFLDAVFGDDKKAIEMMEKHGMFWSWWKNQWQLRDEVYLHDVDGREDSLYLNTRNKLYRSLHNEHMLAAELSIPRTAYPADFTTVKIEMA